MVFSYGRKGTMGSGESVGYDQWQAGRVSIRSLTAQAAHDEERRKNVQSRCGHGLT